MEPRPHPTCPISTLENSPDPAHTDMYNQEGIDEPDPVCPITLETSPGPAHTNLSNQDTRDKTWPRPHPACPISTLETDQSHIPSIPLISLHV